MLYLTIAGVALSAIGGIIIKKTKLTLLGIILALGGAISAVTLGINVAKDDARNSAKCASIDGSYGGDTCYVSGVEQDLEHIEDLLKKI